MNKPKRVNTKMPDNQNTIEKIIEHIVWLGDQITCDKIIEKENTRQRLVF